MMLVALVAVSVSATAALAQKTPDIAEVATWKVKPGAGAAFAAGRQKHMEFHRAQKDTFSWLTWEVLTGDGLGQYYTGTFGHYWKDFDGREKFDALDQADVAKSTGAFAEVVNDGYWTLMPEASRANPKSAGPPAFSQLTHYFVNPADVPRFEDALGEAKTALDKLQWPVYSNWYRLISGGEGPHYVLSTGRDNWAAFAPTEKTLLDGLTEVLGARKANELVETVRASTRRVYTEILAYHPEMSYLAPPAN
jgi:hypothetical protein